MNKKLAASLTIAIFLLSTIAILAPVQAHFTLGQNQPNYPFTTQNFDPHVKGVIGYVWPGGGENTYNGYPTSVNPLLSPGYVAPYPSNAIGKAGAQVWTQNVEQLDGDEYAPSGAIVVGSTGDLIFAINATGNTITTDPTTGNQVSASTAGIFAGTGVAYDRIYIAIPPEFKVPNTPEQVVTTITNNYANIIPYTINPFDRYTPNYTVIRIDSDPQNPIHFYSTGPTGQGEWYYVRINGVTAPTIAGKYFFKIYMHSPGSPTSTVPSAWIPTQNWPVLLVKGELDPAIITGTIRYGGYNSSLYGQPIMEAGMVTAVMTTKLDPYTGAQLTGPLTNAVAYFNGTTGTIASPGKGSDGHYEVEGVAPGIYNLYASAAGYPTALIASNVQILKGQSLHFDGYLNPGPVIHGTVFSKHSFGSEPWPFATDTATGREYIKIELYNKPTVNNVPSSNSSLVSWSPLPCVAGGQAGYNAGEDAQACNDPRAANTIAFPYHDSPNGQTGAANGGAGAVFYGPTSSADPQGVGPAQNWYVVANGVNDQFSYEFGLKGEYGAPAVLSGQVPQVYATWVNGLTPGRYYARAWVFRYVQTALDGSTFQEYSFQVTPNEWAGDISLPMDLRISSWVNKTVHFHDNAGTLSTSPISTGAQVLVGTLTGATSGILYSYNQTVITTPATPGVASGKDMRTLGNSYVQFWGFNDTWLGQNYGIPAGTYKPQVYALGYIQQTQDLVSVTLSGTPIQISNHLYRGVGFNFTVYSIDWEQPRVNRNWVYPGNDIGIGIYDSKYNFVNDACYFCNDGYSGLTAAAVQNRTYWTEFNGTGTGVANEVWFGQEVRYWANGPDAAYNHAGAYVGGRMSESAGTFTTGSATNAWGLFTSSLLYPTALDSGQYHFLGWTYGYIQDKDFTVYANKGQIADMKINLLIGVNITLDILFKKEHLISGTPYNMSARVRVFDDSGNMVATWMSSEGVYGNATLGTPASGAGTKFVTGRATAADGTATYPFDEGLNYLPGGVNLLHVRMAGLPEAPETALGYGPHLGTTYGDPVFTPGAGDFELDNWPSNYWSVAQAHFPNEGILGQPDYTGTGWTAEVDFVNWYLNNTAIHTPTYYPVVPGLLMGESYHIIPGTAAKSGVSFTEDGALNPYFLGHSMVANHLGPYSQEGVWTLGPAHLSGETSAIWEVDLNGYVSGTALAFTWSNELKAISWYTVNIQGAGNATTSFKSYTNDGIYEFYALPGTYSMTISGPGYKTTPLGTISVTSGQSSTPGSGNNVGLPQTNIPVPEFSGIAVVAFSALAASLYLLRRRHQ